MLIARLFRPKILAACSLLFVLVISDVSGVSERKAVPVTPRSKVAKLDATVFGASFRAGLPDVAWEALRGAAEAPSAASVIPGALHGLLRPATSAPKIRLQSAVLAELCDADLRAAACRAPEHGQPRFQLRLRAMLTRDHALAAATMTLEDGGEPARTSRDGDCAEGKPCPVAVVEKGAMVVSVGYRPEETVPEDLTASLAPARMVGGVMIKTYR
jgi:hypothetical protein